MISQSPKEAGMVGSMTFHWWYLAPSKSWVALADMDGSVQKGRNSRMIQRSSDAWSNIQSSAAVILALSTIKEQGVESGHEVCSDTNPSDGGSVDRRSVL